MGDVIQLKRKPRTERFTLVCPCGCDEHILSIEKEWGVFLQCASCGNGIKIDEGIAALNECLDNG